MGANIKKFWLGASSLNFFRQNPIMGKDQNSITLGIAAQAQASNKHINGSVKRGQKGYKKKNDIKQRLHCNCNT